MNSTMWTRIAILALGTFAIGTDGFVVAGVLGDISAQTGVSATTAGQLVTLFAWVYAVASPVLAALCGRLPRRTMLLTALVVFTIGNVLAATAVDFGMLAAGRVVAAIGAAMYTPNASIAAATIASEKVRGRALAVVMGGLTVATVIGVPIGTLIGGHTGYHGVFWLVTALGVVALAGLAVLLPAVPAPPKVGLGTRLSMLRTPGVAPVLAVTTLSFIGGFTVYTYITPMLTTSLGARAALISIMLVVFGIGGASGNAVGGILTDRIGAHRTAVISLVLFIAALIAMPWAIHNPVAAGIDIFVWGAAGWILVPAQQHRLLGLAPQGAPLLISLNASAMYVGIGAAGAIGGAIVAVIGVYGLGPAGAIAGAVALAVVLAIAARRAPHAEDAATPAVGSRPQVVDD